MTANRTPLLLLVPGLLVGCEVSIPGQDSAECTWGGSVVSCEVLSTGGAASGGASAGGDSSGGAAAGGEGGAPPVPPANDTCASPDFIDLASGTTEFRHGSFAGASADHTSFCADGAEDVVFQLAVASECSATIGLDGPAGFDGTLAFRAADCAVDELCQNTAGTQEVFGAVLEVGIYWLVVGNVGAADSTFTLSVECAVPTCGDGLLNTNPFEECDDGNTLAGDGCDPSCAFEAPDPSLDTCAGAIATTPIEIGAGETLWIPASAPYLSTTGATDSGTATCAVQPDYDYFFPAPDHVFRIKPAADGQLLATVGLGFDGVPLCGADTSVEPPYPAPAGCYDHVVHIRHATCEDIAGQVACADSFYWWMPETASTSVVAGEDYFVFVDGWNDDEYGIGPYALKLQLQ